MGESIHEDYFSHDDRDTEPEDNLPPYADLERMHVHGELLNFVETE